jgi:signal transduction histidine kinase
MQVLETSAQPETRPRNFLTAQRVLESLIGFAVLGLLAFFNYSLFFQLPYTGFSWLPSSGTIDTVYVPSNLQPGDVVLSAGPVKRDDFNRNLRQVFFSQSQVGQVVPLTIQRGSEIIVVDWTLPVTPSQGEIWNRLSNQWWLGYIFWAAGQAALLFLRPRDVRWRVFIAFNFLTAIWLTASSLSQTHFAGSAVILRIAMWLCLPVYWHLHWLLPQPLRYLPGWVGRLLYGVALVLAVAEWFLLLPTNAYALGFLLALLGSIIFLLAHFVARPAERRDIGRLAAGVILAIALPIVPGLFAATGSPPNQLLVTLLVLPLLPAAYLYAAFRRQIADLEIRRNRLITIYLFAALLGAALFSIVSIAQALLTFPGASQLIAVAVAMLAVLIAALWFPRFQRFFESKILQIPLPPAHLLETYAARITVSLSEETLVKLLRDEILPSLLIRQSALLRFDNGLLHTAYVDGIPEISLPSPAQVARLLTEVGRYREAPETLPWVHLPLVLTMDNTVRGLWLLGRRDPDDLYSSEDIQLLKSLANQTAIALTNIVQAESLRALYQRDIEQAEAQRYHVARELHDHLLNEIARLETSVDDAVASPQFLAICESLITSIRQTIRDLRPDALNYGLYHALLSLLDDLAERTKGNPALHFGHLSGSARYDPVVELHLYRIVQQACENALKHAVPKNLTVRGSLLDDRIELWVEDDGSGFEFTSGADIAWLAAQKHYGLAGMFERAAITGAKVTITSSAGSGTHINILWLPATQTT